MALATTTWSLKHLAAVVGTASIANALNPIVQTRYTADPAPLVHDGRLYVFTGHDEVGGLGFNMHDYRLYSTDDLANWKDHGSPMGHNSFDWADAHAWASQAIERNGKFYWYASVAGPGVGFTIGVGVADNIEGPYRDAIGEPLVPLTEIDPSVFIDDDGQAYLYWGNPSVLYVKLNEDMISYDGNITEYPLDEAGFSRRVGGDPDRPTLYEEAPWLFKRNDLYYLLWAAGWPETLRYSTGPTPEGPWTYGGMMMDLTGESATNHPGIVEYEGNWYMFYHNDKLPGGSFNTRSVSIEEFEFGEDGSIPLMSMTTDGPAQIKDLDPFVRVEAETIAFSSGLSTESSSQGGMNVCLVSNNDYIRVNGVAFGVGANSFTASVASASRGGTLELHIDSRDSTLIGSLQVPPTGGWQIWETLTTSVEVEGTHDLYFVFKGDEGDDLFNFDWWQFE